MDSALVSSGPRRFVLHPSVVANLWQYPGPLYDAAHALTRAAFSGDMRFVAVDGIDRQVLDLVAASFRGFPVEPLISVPLFVDVKQQLSFMQQKTILVVVSAEPLIGDAFVLATRYELSIHDGLTVALAEERGLPLLVADQRVRESLLGLLPERSLLRVSWLLDEA